MKGQITALMISLPRLQLVRRFLLPSARRSQVALAYRSRSGPSHSQTAPACGSRREPAATLRQQLNCERTGGSLTVAWLHWPNLTFSRHFIAASA